MKKMLTLLSAVMLLVSSMIFVGCDADDEILGPKDKWCMKTFNIGSSSSENENNVDIYCYYSSSEKTVDMGYDTTESKIASFTLKKGLNIVICGNENNTNNNDIFGTVTDGKTPFVVKSFEEGKSIEIEDEEGKTHSKTLKKTIWNLIYICNNWETYSDKTMPLVKSYSNYASVTDLKDSFNIKKILKKMAANKLMEIIDSE